MLTAFALALGQLADARVLRILAKSIMVTLLVFTLLAAAGWWLTDWALARAGLDDMLVDDAAGLRGMLAAAGVIAAGLLLWRIVALAVLQLFADEVVLVVEARYYPDAAASARRLGWHEELSASLAGAGRALVFNLLALPFALLLLVTGIGAPLVFWLVNSVLLGRELMDMVWLRHRPSRQSPLPLRQDERLVLGGVVTALLAVPLVNFLAPFLGAAAATHLIHRKDTIRHAI
jgi:CysZ protein